MSESVNPAPADDQPEAQPDAQKPPAAAGADGIVGGDLTHAALLAPVEESSPLTPTATEPPLVQLDPPGADAPASSAEAVLHVTDQPASDAAVAVHIQDTGAPIAATPAANPAPPGAVAFAAASETADAKPAAAPAPAVAADDAATVDEPPAIDRKINLMQVPPLKPSDGLAPLRFEVTLTGEESRVLSDLVAGLRDQGIDVPNRGRAIGWLLTYIKMA